MEAIKTRGGRTHPLTYRTSLRGVGALPILLETFSRLAYNRRIMVRIAKNDYLTTQQAAAAIGCTDSLVRRLRRQGEFPGAIQFSARVFLFPKKEVVKVAKSPNKLGRPRKNSA